MKDVESTQPVCIDYTNKTSTKAISFAEIHAGHIVVGNIWRVQSTYLSPQFSVTWITAQNSRYFF